MGLAILKMKKLRLRGIEGCIKVSALPRIQVGLDSRTKALQCAGL